MPLLFSLFFGFIPMFINAGFLYWLDRFEQEPKRMLGFVFLWGAVFAAGGAYLLNSIWGIGVYLATGSEKASEITTSTIEAPLIEESLKAVIVLIVFALFRSEFDSIFDGILYAAIAALGFAATENTIYIFEKGYLQNGIGGFISLVFIRVILVGWQHPFYTAFTGIGLAITRLSKSRFIQVIAPIAGYSFAVFTHSFHNLMAEILHGIQLFTVGTFIDWSGWLMMFGFALWALWREKSILEKYLLEDVSEGRLTKAQYQKACSFTHRLLAPLLYLGHRNYRQIRRFYQVCGELAHKKHQFQQYGNEGSNLSLIRSFQDELSILSQGFQVT